MIRHPQNRQHFDANLEDFYMTLIQSKKGKSQKARMAYILKTIGVGDEEVIYATLEKYTPRRANGPYVGRNPAIMINPVPLLNGWFFEGCTNLYQKMKILGKLRHLGFSADLVRFSKMYVAGRSTPLATSFGHSPGERN